MSDTPDTYVVTLNRWRDDGTFDRLYAAAEKRTPVQIKRTSGEMVTGIVATYGHAGLSCVVAWGDDVAGVTVDIGADRVHCPEGVSCKRVHTVDLIAWNPLLGAEVQP
jgi:hypothetical protein